MYLYWSTPWIACYEGEGTGDQGGGDGGGDAGDGGQVTDPKKAGEGKTFTQDELNTFLAQERRKMDAKVKAMEKSVQTALENQNLSQEERTRLEQSLEEVKAVSRTKEQQLIYERKQVEETLTGQLKSAEEKANHSWKLFENSTIERNLLDAAVSNDSFNPQQLVSLLRPYSKLVEKKDDKGKPVGSYEVIVELADRDVETAEPITTTRSPDAAAKRMKELPELYGNLFKNGVVSGLGGTSATGGVQPGKNGRLSRDQIKNLTPPQYAKIRKEQPELLGFQK